MTLMEEVQQRHKRVAWGCEECAEYCDVLPVLDAMVLLQTMNADLALNNVSLTKEVHELERQLREARKVSH